MKVRSARFGEFEVGEGAAIHFPDGLAPFGKGLDFVLVAAADEEEGEGERQRHGRMAEATLPLRPTTVDGGDGRMAGQELAWLQSLQLPKLGFWVGHAGKLFPGRDIGIEAHHLQSVNVTCAEQLSIVLILTIEAEQVTANLLAPVLVNMAAGIGRQVIVVGSIEQVRVPVPSCRVAAEAV